ncbi:SAM-dependent methyltransferase [Nocardia alni]|uniref:SAM-dependent methyltransferase n=1 Tax=Nocardia alni TaxID=2815723 RepID=UPI0027E17BD6|nr:SAM-dependent methyltransferase [Nocardia alni]
MTDSPPLHLRTDLPHSARMYDYFLGGKDNYEADREAAESVKQKWPTVVVATRVNREFMHRVTRFLAQRGVRQFLDIGTGIPTQPNLHEIAQQVDPTARVVYVDNDPIVLTHARALLVSTPQGRTDYIQADARSPQSILDSPRLAQILDLSQPVALSLIALLHFITDDQDPHQIIATLLDALAPGSYLVLSHVSSDFDPPAIRELTRIYNEQGVPLQARSREEFHQLFQGRELLDPGIVPAHRWKPDGVELPASVDAQASLYAAVARV